MKVRSLHHVEPVYLRAAVIVDDLAKPYDLSAFESGSVFAECVDDIHLADYGDLIAVNLDVQDLQALATHVAHSGGPHLQYWVDAEGASQLLEALEALHTLAIDGLAESNGWLKLHLTAGNPTDRAAHDFATGLSTGRFLRPVPENPTQTPVEAANESARSKLMSAVAKKAKPLKPYLPAPVIHTAYRVIGWLR